MKNIGLNPQIDNFHATTDGLTATGNNSPLTLDTTVRTITLPANANSIALHPSEPTRVGFAAALANGYFVISAPYSLTFTQEDMSAVYYRSDSATPDASATLGIDIGRH